MRFVPSQVRNEGAPGADAEAKVFDRLRAAFSGDSNGIGFYKFPVIDRAGDRFDREPDFVILHREYGLVIIEVKGYQIDHIDEIIGQSWILQNIAQDEAQPFTQARDQGFFIQSQLLREPELRDERGNCKIPMNALVALPNISRAEWEAAGHDTNISARVLVGDDLTPSALRRAFDDLPHTETLDADAVQAARAVMTGGEAIGAGKGGAHPEPQTKAEYYQHVSRGLKALDEEQEQLGLGVPPGPQQIRGIAGSGKTVLLAMKAAAMHVKHPDWRIALTFYTRSLYGEIESLVDRFVAHFSEGDRGANLEVLHGWGGQTREGLYYRLAQAAGAEPYDVTTAEEVFDAEGPTSLFDDVCSDLLSNHDVPQRYDAILIDEGQDFDPGFYRLCYHALSDDRQLIWAYDEAQNLTNLTAPTPNRIFGTDEEVLPATLDLTGSYEGGIPKSRVMRRSYRAPRQSLMVAHALGMALKRPSAEIPRITRQTGWRDIGYEVEGDFREVGEEITLTRPEQFSPHPLQDRTESGPFVTSHTFDDRDTEVSFVAESIVADIEEERLDPADILVIPLGDIGPSRELGERLQEELADRDIDANIGWQGNRDIFTRAGEVTISRVHRAKGNEAAQVYVLNVGAVERETWKSNPVQNRNELFVALTRSRAWCTVTGHGESESIYDELNAVLAETREPDPEITFPAPPQRDFDITGTGLPSVDEDQQELSAYDGDTATDNGTEPTMGDTTETSKVYLGQGAPITGWTPVPKSVVTDEIVPLVEADQAAGEDSSTIKVNFTGDISLSGWNDVAEDVVTDDIVPLVKQHRLDQKE